jgi:hypothetical protein
MSFLINSEGLFHLITEPDPVSEMCFLKYQTMDSFNCWDTMKHVSSSDLKHHNYTDNMDQ